MSELRMRVALPVPADEAFAWHERPGALERMTPPWERARIIEREGTIRDGDRVVIELRTGPFAMRLEHQHRDYVAGRRFRDEQTRGPFARFVHTHELIPTGDDTSVLDDHIDYALPAALAPLAERAVRRRIERAFTYRHAVLAHDLARHVAVRDHRRLRVAITGSSGMLGTPLAAFLSTGGHEVLRVVRRSAGPGEIEWHPDRGEIDAAAFEGLDAVVHLAGDNVGAWRWNEDRKHRILRSRVDATALLARTLARLARPPGVFISASAIGYYGIESTTPVDEDSAPGRDFLGEVCTQWEHAAQLAQAHMRVVWLRIGVVLAPTGAALPQMLPLFRLGLGGRYGSGRQYVSWISLDDTIAAIHHLLFSKLAGPVNAVAPHAVTNRELATTLGRVLHRPTSLPVPSAAIRLVYGEMGRLVVLGGAEVRPTRLLASGFRFDFPELEPALRHTLGRT